MLQNRTDYYHSLCSIYKDTIDKLIEDALHHTAKIVYGSASYLMPIGYYCPSFIYEYVIGNVKRGRLLKRHSKKWQFCYHFDQNGKLILIEEQWDGKIIHLDYVDYQDDQQIIIIAEINSDKYRIYQFLYTEKKEGRMVKFEIADISLDMICHWIYTEIYHLQDNNSYTAEVYITRDIDDKTDISKLGDYRFDYIHGEVSNFQSC